MMGFKLSTIVQCLRPFVGQFAEQFVAMELMKLDEKYIEVIDGASPSFNLSGEHTELPEKEFEKLVEILHEPLSVIVGPHKAGEALGRLVGGRWE